jgi:hypothetical protein
MDFFSFYDVLSSQLLVIHHQATLVVSSFMPSIELRNWTWSLTWPLDSHWPYTHTLSRHVICFHGFNNPQLGLCTSIHL